MHNNLILKLIDFKLKKRIPYDNIRKMRFYINMDIFISTYLP